MSSPSFSISSIDAALVQSPTGVRFEIGHHLFGFCFCLDNHVNMVIPYMRRKESPISVRANLPYTVQHRAAVRRIQQERTLVHQIALTRCTFGVRSNQMMSRNVVVPIHGTEFVAVHMRSVAGERNQVRHAGLFYTAPSRSRLGKVRSHVGKARSRREAIVQHYKDILR